MIVIMADEVNKFVDMTFGLALIYILLLLIARSHVRLRLDYSG